MNFTYKILTHCKLFKNFDENKIRYLLSTIKYTTRNFSKEQIIAQEDDTITSVGIILSGKIEVQKSYSSGKIISVAKMTTGNIFGEVIIFSNKKTYPSTIVSLEDSKILFIHKKYILKLCTINTQFLNNFMELLSNRILTLNQILRDISYQTIREKIANFLIISYKNQKSLTIKLDSSRQELADKFGVTRPSLSRELINMKNDKLITFEKKQITILNLDKLEGILL